MPFTGIFGQAMNQGGFEMGGTVGGSVGTRAAPQVSAAQNPLQFAASVGHSLVGLGGAFVNAVVHPLIQAGETAASLPIDAAKQVLDLAHGDVQGAYRAQQNSYLNKEYGSHYAGDTSGLTHAAEFGATALTLGAPFMKATELGGRTALAADEAITPGETVASTASPNLADRIVASAHDFLGAGQGNVLSKTIRNAILTQPTVQFAGKTAEDVTTGKYGSAALDALMWGLPVAGKYLAPVIKAGAAKLGEAVLGKPAILEQLFGHDTVQNYIKANPQMLPILKQIEAFTMNQKHVAGDVNLAAPWLERYIGDRIPGIGFDAGGLDKLAKNMQPYSQKMIDLQELQAKPKQADRMIPTINGKTIDARGVTISNNYQSQVQPVMKAISRAIQDPRWVEDGQFKLNAIHKAVAKLGLDAETVNAHLTDALRSSTTPEEAQKNLDALVTQYQKQIVGDAGDGFIYTAAPDYVAHVPTATEVAGNQIIEHKAASGVAGAVGRAITKAGLSPRAVDEQRVSQALEDNLDTQLQDHGYTKTNAHDLLGKLQTKANMETGISDLRMLTGKMIREAVAGNDELRNVNPGEIAGMLRSAFRQLPAELVGAGPKLTNAVMNPLMSAYLRVQGLGRFEMNPIFIWGKVPIKGAIVAAAHGATMENMTKAFTGQLEDVKATLRNDAGGAWMTGGHLGDSGTASELSGVNARNSAVTARNASQVNGAMQNHIAALAKSVAEANGTTVEQIIAEKGALYNELQKGVGLIKGYGKGGYLNSPLAKSLNLFIFPSRFDTKVVQAAGHLLGRMTLPQQMATFAALGHVAGFLNSPQGQQWQQQNSDFVGLVKYLSPLETLQGVSNFIFKGQHLQDLGEIGGLPFGVITQMITNQVPTMGHLGSSQAYDAQGQPYAHAVPTTVTARAQTAFKDLLSTMFSYPGQTAGLPSKTAVIQVGGKNALTTPAKDQVEYRYENGSLEGSPQAPAPEGQPAPVAPPMSTPTASPVVAPSTTTAPNIPAPPKATKAKRSKTVPLDQQLPGSAAIAAG